LTGPTLEQVEEAIKKSGVRVAQFERYHGMYHGCIYQFRLGFRSIPVKYWHLFLEDTINLSKPVSKKTKLIKKPQKVTVKSGSRLSQLMS